MPCDIYISTTPFGEADPAPRKLLDESGFVYQHNPLGRKMTSAEVAEYAAEATVLIAGTENLMPLMERSKALRMISRVGIGLDGVPLDECKRRGIRVSYTPDAVTAAAAELTIGVMIAATRFVPQLDRALRLGKWKRPAGRRIGESVIGLAGFGRIGSYVARLLTPFRPVRVLVYDRKDKSTEIAALRAQGLAIEAVSWNTLLEESDILSLHLPHAPSTRNILNEAAISGLKPGAFLINTARAELIDEQALQRALENGPLAGAALDVFHEEPYHGPLAQMDNVLPTPHLGSCAIDCRMRMETEAAEDALRFLRGEPLRQEVPEEEYEYQREVV